MVSSIHIVPAISEEASGPSYSVTRLCRELISLEHAVMLAALDWGPLTAAPDYLKTFPLGIGPKRLGRSPAMYRWLRKQCISGQIQVMHNHGMWQMNSIYPAWAARHTSVKLIFSPRGSFSTWAMQNGSKAKSLFWYLMQKSTLKKALCFHATAEAEYQDIRRLDFRQPVAIIPNGIDLLEKTFSKPSGKRNLLFLGRIHKVKGLDLLLPAWKSLQEKFSDWTLKIAGSDDGYHGSSGYLDRLRTQAFELGAQRVSFVGPLYGEDKFKAFHDADLYVLPSYTENFAVTVAEALSMSTPAIVSKGAPWSGLEDNRAGWWIDIGVEPLAQCLAEAMACSPEQLADMGQRGREWMQRDFSWQGIGVKMAETYRWLCDQSLPVPAWIKLD
jgi:glycosyltransferase involved in cell wall biosynthesis